MTTIPAQFIQEAEEAFDRAKSFLALAESQNYGSNPLMVQAASLAARDEIALGDLATKIAAIKMTGGKRA